MSFDHKAYVFDHVRYVQEFEPLLSRALASGSSIELVQHIGKVIGELKHPHEGGALSAEWDREFDAQSPQFTGELALTRYYDPGEGVGLSHDWDRAVELLDAQGLPGDEVVKGSVIGSAAVEFDPGLMGSYLQTPAEVARNLQRVRSCEAILAEPEIGRLLVMLAAAASRNRGLYVIF